jgi:Uma2 family endonuclease
MATAFEGRFTPQEYLARERASAGQKSEYVNGHIYAMGGASLAHNRIVYNLAGELRNQIRGGPCSAVVNDMRVKVPETEMYTYPDVIVFCGEPRLEDDHFDTLLNPTIIIEVLSPSTERYDRGDKWAHFRLIESLQTYVLAAQDQMRVETFTRRGDEWVYAEASGEDGVLNLEAVQCSIRLGAIYELVRMDGAAPKSGPATEEQTT